MKQLGKITNNLKMFDIIILGGGASGLMCGANLPKHLKILIIEAGEKVAQKIKISGGGNCNLTNEFVATSDFLGDEKFLENTLKSISFKDLLNYFNSVEFIKRKNNQYFTKNGSQEIIDILLKYTTHCKIKLSTKCQKVEKNGDIFKLICNRGKFESKVLIVASGGLSFPNLNSSDIGYKIAKNFLHEVNAPNPALVGFTVQKKDFWVKNLSGISLNVTIKILDKNFQDDLLFSHKGLSGPAILNASLFWKKGSFSINFLPNYDIIKLVKKDPKKLISSILPLPKRFTKEFLKAIDLEDKHIKFLTKIELESLKQIHNYTLSPAGTFGYKRAEVTKGGVDTKDINSTTYESNLVKNLYFIGEVLDITGRLGGFNLHFALSSALQMAKNYNSSPSIC